jgi:glycosyltransferase A (GT-A) superfamily protein (DUF2064 family)
MTGDLHLLVMAKSPIPGMVKTRLCPPLSFEEAAAVAEAALADTLAAVSACGAERKVVALDGPAGDWLPEGFHVIAQQGASLDVRLAHAWAAAGRRGVQIGMDTPQVTATELDGLLDLVGRGSAVLGPATDGGWWSIGLVDSDPARVFPGVPMSTRHTGASQLARLRELELDVRVVHHRRDIDTFDDAVAVAAAIPHSATAAQLRAQAQLVATPL